MPVAGLLPVAVVRQHFGDQHAVGWGGGQRKVKGGTVDWKKVVDGPTG